MATFWDSISLDAAPWRNLFRLGFSSIPEARIPAGVEELARLIRAR